MNIPIQQPFLAREVGTNMDVMKQGLPCGNNVFLARSLVYLTGGGQLAAVPTGGTAVYGQAPGPSVTGQEIPPAALYKEVFPWDLREAQLNINITNGDGARGDDGPTLADVAVGGQYGITRFADGDEIGMHALNVDDTTNTFFKVIGIFPGQSADDHNPVVLVEILPSRIQA
jgi:hypothetical protein